jgi:hypothetical protein
MWFRAFWKFHYHLGLNKLTFLGHTTKHNEAREELKVRFKLTVIVYANHVGVTKAFREFNVSRSRF